MTFKLINKLKDGALLRWDRLREMWMREGHGPIQTWRRMKQLLRGRFFPPDYEQYISYANKSVHQGTKYR